MHCSSSSMAAAGSSSSGGLHAGVRVLSPASTSSSLQQPRRSSHSHHRYHQHRLHHHSVVHQQQLLPPQLPRAAAADGPPASSSSSSSQAFRFRHVYKPGQQTGLPQGSWAGWPAQDLAQRATPATEDMRFDPEQRLWPRRAPRDAASLPNPWAQHFRVTHVPSPVAQGLPGSDTYHIEMLNNYSRNWPSLKWVDGKPQFRPGFLEPFDDPKVVPFFFYRGLEAVAYSWSDRAFQLLFAAVYTGVHLALFGWFWASSPPLALAVALNWGLGKLSLAKWALLLFLAANDRTWLYFLFLAGKLVDRGLAALFPPVRRVAVALFTMWLLFVAVTLSAWAPLPWAPFAQGSLGLTEALV